MSQISRTTRAAIAAGVLVGATPAAFGGTKLFFADITALNEAYGSNANGRADLTFNDDDPMRPTLRVQMRVNNLQDLSNIPGAVHLAHIHGQFEENVGQPLPEHLDGPFFSGTGGQGVVNSVRPTAADDGGRLVDEPAQGLGSTRYLDFFEGLPDYGPVVLNLASTQVPAPPNGVSPTAAFISKVVAGEVNPADFFPRGAEFVLDTTYSFDLSDPDQLRQFNNTIGAGGEVLDERLIVVHGLTVPTAISDAIDAAAGVPAGDPRAGVPLGDGMSFRLVAPVAAGEIKVIPLPPAAWAGLMTMTGMGGFSWLRKRRKAAQA